MKNTGLRIAPAPAKDYLFLGSNHDLGTKIISEQGDLTSYLPRFENQFSGFDTWNCVAYSALNAIEIYFNYLYRESLLTARNIEWFINNGYLEDGVFNFSDRFTGIKSGTKYKIGNYGSTVAEAIHKYGLIPEKMLPFDTATPEEYYNKGAVTKKMDELAEEFNKRFTINFQVVWLTDIQESLKYGAVQVYVGPWRKHADTGLYYYTGEKWGHAVGRYRSLTKQILDHYEPYIKSLTTDYNYYPSGYLYTVTQTINFMDVDKFLKDNDLLFVRNKKIGQFGRIMQGKLKVVKTTDRGTLLLLDDAVRKNGRTLTEDEWDILPKTNF